jgi:hypothetical protein
MCERAGTILRCDALIASRMFFFAAARCFAVAIPLLPENPEFLLFTCPRAAPTKREQDRAIDRARAPSSLDGDPLPDGAIDQTRADRTLCVGACENIPLQNLRWGWV